MSEFAECAANERCLDVQDIKVFKLNIMEFFNFFFFFQLLQKTLNIKLYYSDSNTWE